MNRLKKLIPIALFLAAFIAMYSMKQGTPRSLAYYTVYTDVVIVPPLVYVGFRKVEPPSKYRTWWNEIRDCSSLSGDYDVLRWYTAHNITDLSRLDNFIWGVYYEVPPEIVLMERQSPPQLEDTVKHELLHHLLAWNGFSTSHSHPSFASCGWED